MSMPRVRALEMTRVLGGRPQASCTVAVGERIARRSLCGWFRGRLRVQVKSRVLHAGL